MDEAIALLREQNALCYQLLKLFGELTEALKSKSLAMTEITQKIEPAIRQLNKNSASVQDFLHRNSAANFAEFLSAQPADAKTAVAASLLKQTGNLQAQIKKRTASVSRLTKTGSAFVEFNLNVLSQTTANSTYGAAAETGSQSGRRIFDANI